MHVLKIGEIRELIRLLDETSLSELRIETEDMKLSLKKPEATAPVVSAVTAAPVVQSIAQPSAVAATPTVAVVAPSAPEPAEVAKDDKNVHIIKSPMVGTFYRASSPDVAPYTEVGAKVSPKTIVCIVEAMKLMNEIEAETTGEVVEILVENGQLVEYGQPLFKIKLS